MKKPLNQQMQDPYQLPDNLREYASELYPNLPINPNMDVLNNEEMLNQEMPDVLDLDEQDLERSPASMEEETLQEVSRDPAAQEELKAPIVAPQAPMVPPQMRAMQPLVGANIDELIKKQEQDEDRIALWKAGSKMAAAVAGAGLGRQIQPDLSMYEDMQKQAERPLKRILLKQELADKQAKDDPNSEISKMARQTLDELGMDMTKFEGVSFSQLEKLYPTFAQAMYTKVSAQAKVAQAKIESQAKRAEILRKMQTEEANRELKKQQLEQQKTENELNRKLKQEENKLKREMAAETRSLNEENKRFGREVRTHTVIDSAMKNLRDSEEYTLYKGSKEADALLQAALDSNSDDYKTMAAAAFMRYAKTAQGDQSVVRNEDMKVLAGGLNISDIFGKIESKSKGSDLSPQELQAMQKVMRKIQEIKKKDLQRTYINPIENTAKKFNYDLSVYGSVLEDFKEEASPLDKIKKRQEENAKALEELRKKEQELLNKRK